MSWAREICRRPLAWVGVTLVTILLARLLVSPRQCHEVVHCKDLHESLTSRFSAYATCGLSSIFLHELFSFSLMYRDTQRVEVIVTDIRSSVLASKLVCATFGVLLVLHLTILCSPSPWYAHAARGGGSLQDRPVYTLTYAEWLVNVPLLLIIAGLCALNRPIEEVGRPLIVTNVYIIIAWAAFFVEGPKLRWTLVAVSFVLYGWASVDMIGWIRNDRRPAAARYIRSSMTIGLIVLFGLYGVVYLFAMACRIHPYYERMLYSTMDISCKLVMSIAFGGIRFSEYHRLLVDALVQNKVPFSRQEDAPAIDMREYRGL